MTAAARLQREVTVPTVILAELYRGAGRSQVIDSLLARESEAIGPYRTVVVEALAS